MQKLIIDSRIRDVEYNFLSKYFNVIKLPLSEDVYEEISGHSDIFYTKINNKVICAPNSKIIDESFEIGQEKVVRGGLRTGLSCRTGSGAVSDGLCACHRR